jgi:hypothetical protein
LAHNLSNAELRLKDLKEEFYHLRHRVLLQDVYDGIVLCQ